MTENPSKSPRSIPKRKERPFRRAVLRGLGVVLPPLLTIVIFLWVWSTIQNYVLIPVESGARHTITWLWMPKILDRVPTNAESGSVVRDPTNGPIVSFRAKGREYVPVTGGKWVPKDIFDEVSKNPGPDTPRTAEAIYHRYVDITILRRHIVVPVFLTFFVIFLYLSGRFIAAGLGRFLWDLFEQIIHRLPLIRNVYASVKQVTDFVFSEQEIEYTRVVAVEYPRKGIWSLGFVTGESMLDIRSAANEPVLSVLMPTSPMPATGFTVTVKKSETIDLNLSVDQAFQFIVSCGVVVPSIQQQKALGEELSTTIAKHLATQDDRDRPLLPAVLAPARTLAAGPDDSAGPSNGDGEVKPVSETATEEQSAN